MRTSGGWRGSVRHIAQGLKTKVPLATVEGAMPSQVASRFGVHPTPIARRHVVL